MEREKRQIFPRKNDLPAVSEAQGKKVAKHHETGNYGKGKATEVSFSVLGGYPSVEVWSEAR